MGSEKCDAFARKLALPFLSIGFMYVCIVGQLPRALAAEGRDSALAPRGRAMAPDPKPVTYRNRLLQALSSENLALLTPHLTYI